MSEVLVKAADIRLRHEHFGALAWRTQPRRFFRLTPQATRLVLLHERPRTGHQLLAVAGALGLDEHQLLELLAELCQLGVLTPSGLSGEAPADGEVQRLLGAVAAATPAGAVVKPLWVHVQPFTRCNQHCIHCYCSGGPRADPFQLPLAEWRRIIASLDDYGVFDIYVTGGESLLYEEFFVLAKEILDRGMGFGVSTNATLLSETVIRRLRDLRIGVVQVSLDGGNAALHEHIRGAAGSFARTLAGIDRIAEFSQPVINTVVNRLNVDRLEEIVQIGKEHGCTRFKFFPQKPVGRGGTMIVLSDEQILNGLVPECARLAQAHGVEIETVDAARPCGSGSVGFAVDQFADVYPCIFAVQNPRLKAGNLLTDDLDRLWFGSPVFAPFRGEVSSPCRRCE